MRTINSSGSSTVSIWGVSPGRRWSSRSGIVRRRRGLSVSISASNAASATAKSPGYVAMHASLPPKSACPRLRPSSAAQPLPGVRLLHGYVVPRKYSHRVRCRRLPPIVAMLRSCCEAAFWSDSERAGYSRTRTGSAETSLIFANAPKMSSDPPAVLHPWSSSIELMSTSRPARITLSFIRSTNVVPPAMKRPPRSAGSPTA